MAITSVPGIITQSQDAVINSAQASRVQTFPNCSGTFNVNPTDGAFVQLNSIAANTTINFIGVPGSYTDPYGTVVYRPTIWYVEVANRGANTVAFNGVTWDGGSAPSLVSTGRSTILFTSFDGVTINGTLLYSNLSS
jgi:hypothetical protein